MAGRPSRPLVSALGLSGVLLCLLLPASAAPEEWRQATAPREWQFPRDHGAHPAYRTEWWYFTGNLKDEQENAFGYELAFFRQGIRLEAGRTSQPLVVARSLPGPFSRNGRRRKSASFLTRQSQGRVRGLQAHGKTASMSGFSAGRPECKGTPSFFAQGGRTPGSAWSSTRKNRRCCMERRA